MLSPEEGLSARGSIACWWMFLMVISKNVIVEQQEYLSDIESIQDQPIDICGREEKLL